MRYRRLTLTISLSLLNNEWHFIGRSLLYRDDRCFRNVLLKPPPSSESPRVRRIDSGATVLFPKTLDFLPIGLDRARGYVGRLDPQDFLLYRARFLSYGSVLPYWPMPVTCLRTFRAARIIELLRYWRSSRVSKSRWPGKTMTIAIPSSSRVQWPSSTALGRLFLQRGPAGTAGPRTVVGPVPGRSGSLRGERRRDRHAGDHGRARVGRRPLQVPGGLQILADAQQLRPAGRYEWVIKFYRVRSFSNLFLSFFLHLLRKKKCAERKNVVFRFKKEVWKFLILDSRRGFVKRFFKHVTEQSTNPSKPCFNAIIILFRKSVNTAYGFRLCFFFGNELLSTRLVPNGGWYVQTIRKENFE